MLSRSSNVSLPGANFDRSPEDRIGNWAIDSLSFNLYLPKSWVQTNPHSIATAVVAFRDVFAKDPRYAASIAAESRRCNKTSPTMVATRPLALARILGIDFGTRRVGAALSDPGRTIAFPLEIHERRGAGWRCAPLS